MRRRIVIFGNSGSGKSTLARTLAQAHAMAHLDLDLIAWDKAAERRPLADSLRDLYAFIQRHSAWVVEGCYGDLIEAASRHASELHFLDVGIEACIAHCRARPWEPHKYATKAEQDAMIENLIDWVKQYDTRTDEFGRSKHREIFDTFTGTKHHHTTPPILGKNIPA